MNILEDQCKSSNFWDDVENAQDVLKKLSRTKELCSKENLYIQGMSMEQTFEDYYRDLKMLVQDLEDLTEKINKAIYKAQIREQSIVPSNGGVRQ